MFRSPMGEYLEELSRIPAPDLENNERMEGARAGIIDVSLLLQFRRGTRVTRPCFGTRKMIEIAILRSGMHIPIPWPFISVITNWELPPAFCM